MKDAFEEPRSAGIVSSIEVDMSPRECELPIAVEVEPGANRGTVQAARSTNTAYLLATNEPRGEARIIEVDLAPHDVQQGAYPLDPGESVASEHNSREGAEAAWLSFYGISERETDSRLSTQLSPTGSRPRVRSAARVTLPTCTGG